MGYLTWVTLQYLDPYGVMWTRGGGSGSERSGIRSESSENGSSRIGRGVDR